MLWAAVLLSGWRSHSFRPPNQRSSELGWPVSCSGRGSAWQDGSRRGGHTSDWGLTGVVQAVTLRRTERGAVRQSAPHIPVVSLKGEEEGSTPRSPAEPRLVLSRELEEAHGQVQDGRGSSPRILPTFCVILTHVRSTPQKGRWMSIHSAFVLYQPEVPGTEAEVSRDATEEGVVHLPVRSWMLHRPAPSRAPEAQPPTQPLASVPGS